MKLPVKKNIRQRRIKEITDKLREKRECPEVRHKRTGDKCNLNTKSCLIEHGYKCEIYNDYLEEIREKENE
ncbi:hypothetical protein LCGC14_1578060 [marine sediment metagenome]|uniref:Uncharacterized protein n=1 Tax=marine sediment metagenome TaxID=412755 RepID=A0A0F9IHQ6_9ZZZZ